jgi:hypothetical protein
VRGVTEAIAPGIRVISRRGLAFEVSRLTQPLEGTRRLRLAAPRLPGDERELEGAPVLEVELQDGDVVDVEIPVLEPGIAESRDDGGDAHAARWTGVDSGVSRNR